MTFELAIAASLIAVLLAALLAPLVRYLAVGWSAKRKDIMDGLDDDARQAYFEMFSRSNPTPNPAEAGKKFEELYEQWYGRRFFILPTVILALVALCEATVVVFTGLKQQQFGINPFFEVPSTAIAALAGAYMWIVNDFISRARRLDFAPSDVHWATLRLTITIPMGYPATNYESGLSDGAFDWLLNQLQGVGVRFRAQQTPPYAPRALETAHQPWLTPPWPGLPHGSRDFYAASKLLVDPSVCERLKAPGVRADPTLVAAPYAPPNLGPFRNQCP